MNEPETVESGAVAAKEALPVEESWSARQPPAEPLDMLWATGTARTSSEDRKLPDQPAPTSGPSQPRHRRSPEKQGQLKTAGGGPKRSKGERKPKASPKSARVSGLVTGTGVVLDGAVAHRAVVESGRVVSYSACEGETPVAALSAALDGTKGAKVVVLGNLLLKTGVELPTTKHRRSPLDFVVAATSAWPAANLAAVAGIADQSGSGDKFVLAGMEGPVPQGLWDALARAGATAKPLPFVVQADGSWFVVGRDTSWLITVADGRPVAYRELKAGARALPQAAAMAGVELSRLSRSSSSSVFAAPASDVFVLGVPTGPQADEVLAGAGLHSKEPPLDGVERWEIPVVEQGAAALAVRAAASLSFAQGAFASPEALRRAAEAPAKRRRAVATGIVTAAATAIAATGVLPALVARHQLSVAKASLKVASTNEASVARWSALRSEALVDEQMVTQLRAGTPPYAAALSLLTSTAPAGMSLVSVDATPPIPGSSGSGPAATTPTGEVDMTVQANIKSSTFGPAATWQRRLEATGASVAVSSESVLHGVVNLTMTVVTAAPRTKRRP